MATRLAVSEANSLAIADSRVWLCPRDFSHAARQVKSRAASISVSMSASMKPTAWWSMIRLPKVLRSPAYSAAASKAARAMPSACAAMPMRPQSSVLIATLKPLPGSPRTWSASTRWSV